MSWMRGLPFVLVATQILAAGAAGPQALAPPPAPAGNPPTRAKINLGKTLFWDEQLSSTRTVACGTCHRPSAGGADPRSVTGSLEATRRGPAWPRAATEDVVGSAGVPLHGRDYGWSAVLGFAPQVTSRRALPVVNAAYYPALFADGRAGDVLVEPGTRDTLLATGAALEAQCLVPILSAGEMAGTEAKWRDVTQQLVHAQPLALATRIPADLYGWIAGRTYRDLFREAFGDARITPGRIAMAVGSYERTLVADRTPLDSLLAGLTTLRPAEARGRALFDSLGCVQCHAGPLLTDGKFHAIGVGGGRPDSGRALVTHRGVDVGAFRTPSLRNVSLRRVFMHGGQVPSLERAVMFYYGADDEPSPGLSPLFRHVFFTRPELEDLLAFLRRPLTDPRLEHELPPFDRPTLYSESGLAPEVVHEVPGVAGAGGGSPEIFAIEPPLVGGPGFTIAVDGGLGGAAATLVVAAQDPGAEPVPRLPGEVLRRRVRLRGHGRDGGFASVKIELPARPQWTGRVLHARWYVADPGARHGVAVSSPLRIRPFGPHGMGAAAALPTDQRTPRLYPARSSPEGTVQVIRYDLFSSAEPSLVLEDSTGAPFQVLLKGGLRGPGSFLALWDGRDSSGAAMPRGRYFARLETKTSSQRIALEGGW